METLAGQCGQPGFQDGGGHEALFSASIWDAVCAPRDCAVIVSDPSNHALRRVQLPAGSCAAGGAGGGSSAGALRVYYGDDGVATDDKIVAVGAAHMRLCRRAKHGHDSAVMADDTSFAVL